MARVCDTFEDLLDILSYENENCLPPLPDADVHKTTCSAWRYEQAGQNFAGEGRRIFTFFNEIDAFQRHTHGPDAALLLLVLRRTHINPKQPFALAPLAMADAGLMAGWGKDRFRNAIAALVEVGSLRVVQPGGRGKGDPALYTFRTAR